VIRPEAAERPFTVSELALEVRRALRPLSSVLVMGEVSGMKLSAKGHYSFAIRDAGAVVQAFLFAGDARRLGLVPEDGQEFIFRGRVDFWPQGGQLRLVVEFIQFDDFGRMRSQLEALKMRLETEGAFSTARKRALPFLPRVVALVTSPTGAVIHDLQETILDRFPNMEILVYAAQVQGTASPASVVAALRRCNREGRAEVAVIARGGGSFEELYAFNTEPVARAILASRVPVVTALGHTSDRTVADMVADAECRTPTEAATRIVPSKADLSAQLAERGPAGAAESAQGTPGTVPGRARPPEPGAAGGPSPRSPGPPWTAPRRRCAESHSCARLAARGEARSGAPGPGDVRAAQSRTDRPRAPRWAPSGPEPAEGALARLQHHHRRARSGPPLRRRRGGWATG
jgi:exodeoxyribonuclease VII large subunit